MIVRENQKQSFSFELTAVGAAPLPADAVDGSAAVTITDEGRASFGAITYTKAGTYEYKLKELAPETVPTGYRYDTSTYDLEVVVTDSNGKLNASWTAKVSGTAKEELVFTNDYTPVPATVTVPAKKTVQDAPGHKHHAATFSFELSAITANAPMPADAANNKSVIELNIAEDVADISESFAAITFTQEGVYEYSILEVQGSEKGYTYDTDPRTLTITVTDNQVF